MIRRPLIWAFGVLALWLAVAFCLGLPLSRATALDEAVGEESVRAIAEGTVTHIASGDSGGKVSLGSCRVYPGAYRGNIIEYGDPLDTHGILAYVDDISGIEPGDVIRIIGRLRPFPAPENPGEFDSRRYYRTSGLDYGFETEKIYIVEKGSDSLTPRTLIYRLRGLIAGAIDRVAEDAGEAGLFKAVLLGDRTELNPETYEAFRLCGIAHILAVSGLHLSLLGQAVLTMLRKLHLPYPLCAALTGGMMLIYVLMLDGRPSAWRALIMFTVSLAAPVAKRTYDLLSAAGLAGILLLISRPLYIADGAFQLSFAAIAGVGLIYPELAGLVRRVFKDRRSLLRGAAESVALSLSIWLATLPVTAHNYYSVSMLGIFLNLLALPMMTLIMASVAAGAAAGVISASAGMLFAGAGHYCFEFLISVCKAASALPGTGVVLGEPGAVRAVVYVILLTVPTVLMRRIRTGRFTERPGKAGKRPAMEGRLRALCLTVMLFSPLALIPHPPAHTTLTALYVGQGDSTVIRGSDGSTVLIDCGSSDRSDIGSRVILPYIKYTGTGRIDMIVLSHSDGDHVNGLYGILDDPAVSVGCIALPDATVHDASWSTVLSHAEIRGVQVLRLRQGDEISAGELAFTVLSPGEGMFGGDQNENSLVLEMKAGEYTALFCGDIGEKAETELLRADSRRIQTDIDYLKCPHHGSRFSSSEAFVSAVSPVLTVISAGRDNLYGHPSPETVGRLEAAGSRVLCTAEKGAVTTVFGSGKELLVSCYNDP